MVWWWRILLACSVLAACQRAEPPTSPTSESRTALPGVIVAPTWLEANHEAVLILDARPLETYQEGHIPGAISLPVADIDGEGKGRDNLAPIPTLEALFGRLGVRMDRPVVVYDAAVDHRPAARLFWALEVHGHPEVGVLNGGLPAWQTASPQPLQVAAPTLRPGTFTAILQPKRLATQMQVLRASSTGGSLLLDARSRPEYMGEASGGARMGHIEGALHHDFADNLMVDETAGTCQVHPLEDLQAQYSSLPDDEHIIAYCNTGTHASVSYLALRALGRDVSVYDGGWVEWSGNPRLPIQTGLTP